MMIIIITRIVILINSDNYDINDNKNDDNNNNHNHNKNNVDCCASCNERIKNIIIKIRRNANNNYCNGNKNVIKPE